MILKKARSQIIKLNSKISHWYNTENLVRKITLESIDPRLVKAEYAVRGAVVNKAFEYEQKLKNDEKLPFPRLIYCNIGNPQQLKQSPLSYLREVISIVNYPELLNKKHFFNEDIRQRALEYINNIPVKIELLLGRIRCL